MLKPNRGLNKNFADKTGTKRIKKARGRRAAIVILILAACSAAVLTACGTGLKISLSRNENSPASRTSSASSESASAIGETSSQAASSALFSAQSPSDSSDEQKSDQVKYEDAKKPLWITVSLNDQNVSILDADNRLVYQFSCSTGKPGDDTPTGSFSISDKGKSFYNPDVEQGAYYWTRFKGTFLFHSLPFDSKQNMISEEADKLGTKASHGCVRLTVENAKWIYDNIPKGTKVVVE